MNGDSNLDLKWSIILICGFKWFYPLLPCTAGNLDGKRFHLSVYLKKLCLQEQYWQYAAQDCWLLIAYILLSDSLMVPPDLIIARMCWTPLSEASMDAFIKLWLEAQANIIIWKQSVQAIISQSLMLQSLPDSTFGQVWKSILNLKLFTVRLHVSYWTRFDQTFQTWFERVY